MSNAPRNTLTIKDPFFIHPPAETLKQYEEQKEECDLLILTMDGGVSCHCSIWFPQSKKSFSVYNFQGTSQQLQLILKYFYYGEVSIPREEPILKVLVDEFERIRPEGEVHNILKTALITNLLINSNLKNDSAKGRPSHDSETGGVRAAEGVNLDTNETVRKDANSPSSPRPGPSGLNLSIPPLTALGSPPSKTKDNSTRGLTSSSKNPKPQAIAGPSTSSVPRTSSPPAKSTNNENEPAKLQETATSNNLSQANSRAPASQKVVKPVSTPLNSSSARDSNKTDSSAQCDKYIPTGRPTKPIIRRDSDSVQPPKSVHFAIDENKSKSKSKSKSTSDKQVKQVNSKPSQPTTERSNTEISVSQAANIRQDSQKKVLTTVPTVKTTSNFEKESSKSKDLGNSTKSKGTAGNENEKQPGTSKERRPSQSSTEPAGEKLTKKCSSNEGSVTPSRSAEQGREKPSAEEGKVAGQKRAEKSSSEEPRKDVPTQVPPQRTLPQSNDVQFVSASSGLEDKNCDIKIFKCKICRTEFKLKMALKKHMSKFHSKDDQQQKQGPPSTSNKKMDTSERRGSLTESDVDMRVLANVSSSQVRNDKTANNLGSVQQKTPLEANKSFENPPSSRQANSTSKTTSQDRVLSSKGPCNSSSKSSGQNQRHLVQSNSEKDQPVRINRCNSTASSSSSISSSSRASSPNRSKKVSRTEKSSTRTTPKRPAPSTTPSPNGKKKRYDPKNDARQSRIEYFFSPTKSPPGETSRSNTCPPQQQHKNRSPAAKQLDFNAINNRPGPSGRKN